MLSVVATQQKEKKRQWEKNKIKKDVADLNFCLQEEELVSCGEGM